LLGNCIGPSYELALIARAPERVAAAVLQQPIGSTRDNRPLFRNAFDSWASDLAAQHPEASDADFASFRDRLYGSDFVFSISREQARSIRTPLLLLSGNDAHHPSETSRELAALVPGIEVIERWKEPELAPETVQRVRAFLREHTPR